MTYLLNFLGINYSNWDWLDFALFMSFVFLILLIVFYFVKKLYLNYIKK